MELLGTTMAFVKILCNSFDRLQVRACPEPVEETGGGPLQETKTPPQNVYPVG
jgi:hypothetical protein